MKHKWVAAALALMLALAPCVALASQTLPVTAVDKPDADMERSLQHLEEVFATDDPQKRFELIVKAAEASPENVELLVSCAQLLFYLDEGDEHADMSEIWLQKALEIAQGEEKAYPAKAYAEQLVYWGRVGEAYDLIRGVAKDLPEDESLRTTLAMVLYYNGQNTIAIDVLEELLEDAPRNLEARRLRAAILLDECRWEESLSAYRQIETDWPEYLDGLYGQYMVYAGSGEFEMAVRTIDEMLGLGGEEELWLTRARIRLWNQYLPEQAIKEADALLRSDPEWIDAATVKLVSLIMLDRFDEAAEVTEQVAKVDTDHAQLLLSIVRMNEGEWTQAEALLLDLQARLEASYFVSKSLSMVYLDGYGDVQRAQEAIAEAFAITQGQGELDMYMQLGHVYRRQGEYLQAARAYTAADNTTYEDASPLFYLVMICIDAGRAEDTQAVMDEMLRRYPGWYETMLAQVLVENALENRGEALEAYAAYEEKFPFPAAQSEEMKALLLAANGDAQGLHMLEEAMEGKDPTAEALDNYAYALLEMGEPEEALSAVDEAIQLLPERSENNGGHLRMLQASLWSTRAEVLLEMGNLEESMEAFGQAASFGWPVHTLALSPRYEELMQSEAFEALLQAQPFVQEEWDLTVAPAIPER